MKTRSSIHSALHFRYEERTAALVCKSRKANLYSTNYTTDQRKEEDRRKQAYSQTVAVESQSERNEDAIKRALQRETQRLARTQTSTSSMASPSPTNSSTPLGQGIGSMPSPSGMSSAVFGTNMSQKSSLATQTMTSSGQHGTDDATAAFTGTNVQAAAGSAGFSQI